MLKGLVTIEVKEYNKDNILQTVKVIKEENTICIRTLEQLIGLPSIAVFNNNANFRIVISSISTTPVFTQRTLTNIFATGDKSPFPDSFVYNKRDALSLSNPSDVTYRQRFVAPTATRTINSIALADNVTLQNNVSVTTNILTYLKLTAPITQTNVQTLDVSYRVVLDWSTAITAGLDKTIAKLYELFLFDTTILFTAGNFLSSNKINTKYYNPSVGINYIPNVASGGDATASLFNLSLATNTALLQNTTTILNTNISAGAIDVLNFLGRFVSSYNTMGILLNFNTDKPYANMGFLPKTTNLSDVTSHSITSTLATYDTNNLANSSWRPNITDGPETDFPSVYILKVSQSGGLGVGRYKIYKSGWGGWPKGLWSPALAEPFLSTDFCYLQNQIITEDDYDTYNTRWLYKWNSTLGSEVVVSYIRNKGVGLYTITDRALTLNNKWEVNTNTLGTYIYGIAASPNTNKIYVAMDNGLHEINVTTGTTSVLNSDKCLAVCVGFNDQVFAIFNPSGSTGRLSGSIGTNWSTPLSLGATPPTINWSNIWRIYIDNKNANYQLMFIEGTTPQGVISAVNGTGTRFIRHWWSNTIGIQRTDIITHTANAAVSRKALFSDLIMFPSHNSVIGENGVWAYSNEFYYDWATTLISTRNMMQDLEIDFLNSNSFIQRNAGFHFLRGTVNKGNSAGIDYINGISSSSAFINKVKIAVGLFAQAPLNSFFSSGNSCGDWIKPRLQNETNVFSVIFTICNHTTNTNYFASTGALNHSLAPVIPTTLPRIQDLSFVNTANAIQYTNNRMGIFVKVDFNLTGPTLEANIIDYTDIGTTNTYSLNSQQCGYIANIKVTHDKRVMIFDEQSNLGGASIRMYSPIHVPLNDLNDILVKTWGWNNTTSSWEDDPLNDMQGRLLHATTEPLVDGLSITWNDLQPSSSKNLILGQYYVFTKLSAPNQVAIEHHTPPLSFLSNLQLRQYAQGNTTISIPNTTATFVVKEAPAGSSPNVNWYSMNNTPTLNSNHITSATINGVTASIAFNNSTSASAGTIIINDNGRIRVNATDINKTLVLNYSYALKYSSDETPLI
jgi:hypothetical protein